MRVSETGVGPADEKSAITSEVVVAATVIAVDRFESKLALAAECGADHAVVAAELPALLRRIEPGRQARLVVDFVGTSETMALATDSVGVAGAVRIVGAAGGEFPFSFRGIAREASIQASYWGSIPELRLMLQLAADDAIRPRITRVGFDEILDAYQRMAAGELVGRAVLIPAD